MKKLLAIIVLSLNILTFSFQSLTKANDIKDFEIEGISIGDNLINFMTRKEIVNNAKQHYPKGSKFFETEYMGAKKKYHHLLFHIKRKDNNFKIYLIRAVNIVDNLSDCKKIKKVIVKELKELFVDAALQEASQKHYFYKNSTQYISQFSFRTSVSNRDLVRVECMIADDKDKKIHGNVVSTLEVVISTHEFSKWIDAR